MKAAEAGRTSVSQDQNNTKTFTLSDLQSRINALVDEGYGDFAVRVLTESDSGQVEQPCADLAVSSRCKHIILLPEDF